MSDGRWEATGDKRARADFLYQPPEEYDFVVAFTVIRANGAVGQVCCCAGHQSVYHLGGWENTIAGFETIGGVAANQSKTARRRDRWLYDSLQIISKAR